MNVWPRRGIWDDDGSTLSYPMDSYYAAYQARGMLVVQSRCFVFICLSYEPTGASRKRREGRKEKMGVLMVDGVGFC